MNAFHDPAAETAIALVQALVTRIRRWRQERRVPTGTILEVQLSLAGLSEAHHAAAIRLIEQLARVRAVPALAGLSEPLPVYPSAVQEHLPADHPEKGKW